MTFHIFENFYRNADWRMNRLICIHGCEIECECVFVCKCIYVDVYGTICYILGRREHVVWMNILLSDREDVRCDRRPFDMR